MIKSLIPYLNRMMPVIMLAFLALALLQVILIFAPHWQDIMGHLYDFLSWARPAYFPLSVFFTFVVISGAIFNFFASRLAQKGLFLRKGFIMDVLRRLTNREKLEEMLERQQREATLDAAELSAALRSKIIGQDEVCEDISHQLRRRLALRVRNRPVGVFLLAGPPGTGKTYLAKQISQQTQRPLLHFDMTQMSSPHAATLLFGSPRGYVGSDTFGGLTGGLKEQPNAVVLLDEIEKAHPDVLKKFLTAWNDGHVTEASTGEQVSTNDVIFVLTSNIATEALTEIVRRTVNEPEKTRAESVEVLSKSGMAPEVLNRIDRIFVFKALEGLNLARVAALEIEKLIESYDLQIENEGIDPALLFALLTKQQKLGSIASARDLTRSVEDMLGESLILARQSGATKIRLEQDSNGVRAVSSSAR
ncbi:ATP-dependent Clp protease ATP-binding subunit [Acetobacteraceae bacterium]|nr:ATP-dependent Clp protease ATP-binding subunit [Acetobacteraceae bacterium]